MPATSRAIARDSAASADVLVVDDVVKRFNTPEGQLTAVDHVSLGVRQGEFMAVIGPSGCGKSTLFNIIGGLVDGYDGRVSVTGGGLSRPPQSLAPVFSSAVKVCL